LDNVARMRSAALYQRGQLQSLAPVKQNEPVSSRQALADAVALWEVTSAEHVSDVIDAAVDALVSGLDSPSLGELAGARPTDSYRTLRPLAQDCLAELGIDYPGPQVHDLQVAAARAMCRRLLATAITPRELATWAHVVIGHEGAPELQQLVELDDLYDDEREGGHCGQPAAALDDLTIAEVHRLLDAAQPH
jgi:hypothetical protein